jgi:hypothetical protein
MSDAEKSQQPEEPKVKVSDRRRFTAEGEARDPSEVDPEPETAKPAATSSPAAERPAAARQPEPQPEPEHQFAEPEHEFAEPQHDFAEPQHGGGRGVPPASLELLVLSLAMQAQMELGLGDPQPGHVPNLDIARHTIDLLAILQEKTKGHLTLDEQRLLENTVTELRYRYVQALEKINRQATS